MGLVALQLFTLNTRWLVTPNFLDEPPERRANFTAPDPQFAQRISFERQIALVGYDLKLRQTSEPSQGFVDLTLHWQALAQPPHAYTVFTHVVDGEGRLVGQQDNMPLRDQLPTSCWQPGEFIADPYRIAFTSGFSGPLSIEVGLYRLDTLERLSLDDGSGTSARLSLP
ncbi:MAG TPA: hypothetical protein VJ754_00700 [Anaerolineae bacterium]|nr:hypothetical protein [Anaerolineae bacterium]